MARTVKLTTIDLWSQINGGQQLIAEEQAARDSCVLQVGKKYSPAEGLALGHSHREDVFAHCGIKPKKLIWHARGPEQFPNAENWPYAQVGELYLSFDPDGIWQGLSWEPGLAATSVISVALGEHERTEADDVVAGHLRLLLNGAGMAGYVALPDFIGMLSQRGLTFSLDAVGYDKWLQLEGKGKTGSISASFNLQALKAQYESRFEIDYLLTSVSLQSHAFDMAVSAPWPAT